jgi:hypothetical protein
MLKGDLQQRIQKLSAQARIPVMDLIQEAIEDFLKNHETVTTWADSDAIDEYLKKK